MIRLYLLLKSPGKGWSLIKYVSVWIYQNMASVSV